MLNWIFSNVIIIVVVVVACFQLRKINRATFPVKYDDNFYKGILEQQNAGLNKFAYYRDKVVGAVCSRIEPISNSGDFDNDRDHCEDGGGSLSSYRVYIMTLAVLAAYRGRGIGSEMLRTVLEYCNRRPTYRGDGEVDRLVVVSEIFLHVQICNHDAIRFYTERFDFEQGEMVENYYRRINPPHCFLLSKKLKPPLDDAVQEDDALESTDTGEELSTS